MIFLGLHSRGLRASRVRNPSIVVARFRFSSFRSRPKKSQLRAMRKCAISAQSPKIEKMNTHSQKDDCESLEKTLRFRKTLFGIFLGFQTIDPLIIGRVAIRGVFRFSRICRDLVRDLPRTHLNARVHRDRDVHPLTRP